MIGCKKKAKWEINYGRTTDDYTHACTKHVGELLHEDRDNTVYLFRERYWPLSGGALSMLLHWTTGTMDTEVVVETIH